MGVLTKVKSVFVRAYLRFRFGRIEHVCQHWRSHPGQLAQRTDATLDELKAALDAAHGIGAKP